MVGSRHGSARPQKAPPPPQVKVKRRGSDTKYVAAVQAVGVECDIAMLTGGWVDVSSRGWGGGGVDCLPTHRELQAAGVAAGAWRGVRQVRGGRLGGQPQYATRAPLPPTPPPAVEDEEFWGGLQAVAFGELPRLQDSVVVIG